MRKLLTIILGVLTSLSALLYAPVLATADGPNLIANPSMETASGSVPQGWQSGGWGTNARAFTYLSTGHTGTRSVKTQITSYTSGDAKWYFTPVMVSPNTTYVFSDYYQANVATRLVVQVTATDNSVSYMELPQAVATSGTTWGQAVQNFTTPANAKTATVFHLLDKVGALTIDDANLATYATPPPNPDGNLVLNPSVEQASANPSVPAEWTNNKWGTNTATFSYLSTGHTGARSVKTQVTNYSSGDAKWYFTPVTVTAGSYYSFSDWYQANVATEVVAQFTKTDGTISYSTLGSPAASAAWAQTNYNLTIPAGVNKLTVLHVIAANGSLTIDDANVQLALAPPPSSNPVPNPSLETSSGGQPVAWSGSKWGTNTANFQYMNEGHTGTHSAKVTVSNYTDGDAKWIFDPQPLTKGAQYRFTGWYKTNAQPHVVMMSVKADGTEEFFGMPEPLPPAGSDTTWQKYSDTFTVPSDAVSVSVFMFMRMNGWVQVDDFSIEPYQPVGFTRPLVTLTFDDGHEDNVTTALPIMQQKGFKSTQCYATQYIEGVPGGPEDVTAFKNAGHEICSHSVTHPYLTQVTPTQLTYELTHSQQYLQQLSGQQVKNFASPFGDYNATMLTEVKKYYRSHRSTDEGFNSKDNFNIYNIRVQNMQQTTTLAQYQAWLDQAKATNTWLVLVYHRILAPGTTDGEQFDTWQTDFTQQMNALQTSNLTVKTYNDALDELVPQAP